MEDQQLKQQMIFTPRKALFWPVCMVEEAVQVALRRARPRFTAVAGVAAARRRAQRVEPHRLAATAAQPEQPARLALNPAVAVAAARPRLALAALAA